VYMLSLGTKWKKKESGRKENKNKMSEKVKPFSLFLFETVGTEPQKNGENIHFIFKIFFWN